MNSDDLRGTDVEDGSPAGAPRGGIPSPRAMTRRGFLRSSLGLTGLMLLAACSPATQPAAPASKGAPDAKPAAPAARSAEKGGGSGGQVILTSQSEPLTLNPAFTPVSTTIYYSQFLFDGLTRPDDNLRPVPSLAESWQVAPDSLNYTFNLRKGVKFHDGKDLTAADVKFTWEVIAHPSNKAGAQIYGFFSRVKGAEAYHSGAATEISGVTTPDDYTVKVELDSIYAPFLSISAFQPILPKHVYGAVPIEELEKHATARAPVGTGPFKLTEWRTNEQLAMAAHTEYWGGRPKLDRLIVKTVPDSTTLPSLLRSGEVDVVGMFQGLPAIEYDAFVKDSGFKVLEMAGYSNRYIEFNLATPLFQDVRVRRAMIHAVDREGIVKNVQLGHGRVVDTAIHPSSWGYTEPKTNYEYDVDQAKALLKEAGWAPGADGILVKDGQPFRFEMSTFMPDYPIPVQEQWRQVGIDCQLKQMDFAAMWGPIYLARKFEAAGLHVIIGIYTDPDYPLGGYFHSRLNRNAYKNPKVDELIEKATATLDEGERKRLYAEFLETMAQDAPHIWVMMPDEIWATSNKIDLPDKKLGFLLFTNVKDWERVS
jgi:peptide/nickel transport system substrate-binding protein